MKKYVVSATRSAGNNASTKPKQDINSILINNYHFIPQNIKRSFTNKHFNIKREIEKKFSNVKKGDLVLFNYPIYMRKKFDYYLVNFLKDHGVIIVALIHDIDTLRYQRPITEFTGVKREAEYLNSFNYVIVPNLNMQELLVNNGLKTPIIILGIFDYLNTKKAQNNNIASKNIVSFAGNLNKASFLNKLQVPHSLDFKVYGKVWHKNFNFNKSINYQGSFTPDVLTSKLGKGLGLVWDGNTIQGIKGKIGKYLKYNSPYKASLYLSAGMPIIIWRQAALANFVKQHDVGILIDNLDDLKKVSTISEKRYQILINNADKLSKKLLNGFYTKRAIDELLWQLDN